jgi:hypothetical protein
LARVPFLLVLIAVFGLGMAGLLMLNTTLQNQAFETGTLHRQASELAYSQADLESKIDHLAAPQELVRRASALGLRPNPHPAFLVLPKGKIVGKPIPVSGNEVPTLVIKTPAELAAERAAAVAKAKAKEAQKVADAKAKAAQQVAEAKAKAALQVEDAKTKAAQQVAQAKAAKAAAAKKAAAQKTATKKAPQTTKKPKGNN